MCCVIGYYFLEAQIVLIGVLDADGKGEHDGGKTDKGDAYSKVMAMHPALKRRVCASYSPIGFWLSPGG